MDAGAVVDAAPPFEAAPPFIDDAPTRPEPLVGDLPIADRGSLVGDLPIAEPEPEPDSEPAEPADTEQAPPLPRVRRWLHALRRQLPYALVLLTMAIGLLRIVQYHWREGSAWIGGALLVAALLRAVIPPRTIGMVAVRGRAVDVLWCVGLAACILFVAYTLKA
jgi:hypothetical protein